MLRIGPTKGQFTAVAKHLHMLPLLYTCAQIASFAPSNQKHHPQRPACLPARLPPCLATFPEFHRRAIDKHAAEVTGLLLMYPSVMVHVLEASTPALMDILTAVNEAPAADSRIAEARVSTWGTEQS